MKKAGRIFSLFLCGTGTVAVAVACSSKTSNDTGSPVVTPIDSGCIKTCCDRPQPNTSCAVDAGTMCTYAKTCPEGLVLAETTTCTGGIWVAGNDCPAAGAVDDRGCPGAQPANGSPCSPGDGGGFQTCGYSKACTATACDGGVCQQVVQSASASCVMGAWMTTPLGPC